MKIYKVNKKVYETCIIKNMISYLGIAKHIIVYGNCYSYNKRPRDLCNDIYSFRIL